MASPALAAAASATPADPSPAPATTPATTTPATTPPASPPRVRLAPLPPFTPDLFQRGWASVPHPTLPLLATAHNKSVTIFSLATLSAHSTLTGGHSRSVRSVSWKPGLPPHKLCLVTGSFDSTAGLWQYEGGGERETATAVQRAGAHAEAGAGDAEADDWEFTVVLEGQEHEIKSVAFSPSGQFLATSSRDKSVWIWEDVGGAGEDDEWETLAVLGEHDGDVKCVAWCPEWAGAGAASSAYGHDVLASASYDNTVRLWREDADAEWVCVAVLAGHAGTVWGVQWEGAAAAARHPRLLSWSADQTLRVWALQTEPEDDETLGDNAFRSVGIPNTMRRAPRETWTCVAVLPRAHTRDIYSASWSAASGLVASTGSDGTVVVYAEVAGPAPAEETAETDEGAASTHWRVVASVAQAHGPYEINNITWCRRFDAGVDAARRGVEEMLVTTGDDGVVRPWQVVVGNERTDADA